MALRALRACVGLAAIRCGAKDLPQDDEGRRLYSVPLPTDLAFADSDLASGAVGGTLSWVPPSSVSEVISYTVYLSDGVNTPASRITQGTVAVGTNSMAVSSGTAVGSSATHFFVHSESALGLNPNGAGLEICDVAATDSLFLQNAVATTAPWGLSDLTFHRQPDCSDAAMAFVQAGLSGSQVGYEESKAVDGDVNTPWVSSCTSCTAGQALIGVLGVCKPDEVKCVQLRQCTLNRGTYGCPLTADRASQISLLVQGQHTFTWRVMQGQTDSVTPALELEVLTVPSRRRRATVSAFVDVSYQVRSDAVVNPSFSSR